jgi:Arc/MetJ-type ribon-helix-helix transcriptional regulator
MIGAWLRRFFSSGSDAAGPEAANDAPGELTDEIVEEMREYIRSEVAGGYGNRDDAVQLGVDMLSDQVSEELLLPVSERLVDEALAEHARIAADWPEVTDCDRLDAAFTALERDGIVARQNFSCCGTCGAGEIWDEIAAADASGGSSRGYAFFHVQDTERAVEGDGLYLNYGACAESESAAVGIAHEIVAQLEKAGLKTDWNGTYNRRIGVSLDWKRRRAD